MRVLALMAMLPAMVGLLTDIASAATSTKNSSKAKAPAAPAAGIKVPGVQIPFANLKPEADVPAPGKPSWLYFADSLYVPNLAKDSLEKLEAKTAKAGDPISGIKKPCSKMASAFGSLWIPSCAEGQVVRLDAKTLKKQAEIAVGTSPGTVAVSGDSVWMLVDNKTTLSRIDPDKNEVVSELRLPEGCKGLTFGESALWVACPSQDKVLRIDPATNLVTKRVKVSATPEAIAVGEGSIWVLCTKDGKVDRLDPKTDKVSKTIDLDVRGAGGEIAFGDGSVWVTMTGFPLTRISPSTDKVVQQFYGQGGGAIQTSPGVVWLSNVAEGTVWRVDTRRVAATLAE